MKDFIAWIIAIPIAFIVVFGQFLLASVVVWLIWNWLCPMFNLPSLTWLQSTGMFLLIRIMVNKPSVNPLAQWLEKLHNNNLDFTNSKIEHLSEWLNRCR